MEKIINCDFENHKWLWLTGKIRYAWSLFFIFEHATYVQFIKWYNVYYIIYLFTFLEYKIIILYNSELEVLPSIYTDNNFN